MAEGEGPLRDSTKQLGAWFLGPKAENASLEEEMVLYILRDYFHWRRNYYPSDEIIITQHMRRESSDWADALFQQLSEMLGRLKRHFPFYSPRYIAHMLSDQTIPSVLGYFAGMLYNPNNVTPEAAPVTVEWEMEVAADILRMLGYRAPPPPGAHHREMRKEFGWAHITSGGTVANLEALWFARNIRYFPLAARDIAERERLELRVKLPGLAPHDSRELKELDPRQCLCIKPNEAIFLLPRFLDAVKHRWNLDDHQAAARGWELLRSSPYSVSAQGGRVAFGLCPPALFAAGTAHYSVLKAADVLGLGKENVILVDTDRAFRLEVGDLERRMKKALADGMFPLAVVAIAGTTEEGAVDPVHHIDALRSRLESEQNFSFWLHVDAAWAGYVRSLFVSPSDARGERGATTEALIEEVNGFTARSLDISRKNYRRVIRVQWGSNEVCHAFLAFPRAESIVVDPHKMGYIPYPCGVVAFRNDRVRHFMTQEAPYITETSTSEAPIRIYRPPVNVGPFILEGSKPGAAAAACWLSHRMIPPNRAGYGEIVRASLLAARELYERLIHWEQSCRANRETADFQFVPISIPPPDTNIVCFVVKRKGNSSLRRMNALAEAVFRQFTIQAELGQRDYAYSQPFFLSRTRFHPPNYSERSVGELLERLEVDAGDYPAEGLFVLRATVMNPYIVLADETGHKQDLLAEFVETLAHVTASAL